MTVYDIYIYIYIETYIYIYTHLYIHIYIYTHIYILILYVIYLLIYFCISYISSHRCATKGLIPWCSNVIHHEPRVPKSNPKGPIPPCWSPKSIPCPSPVSPSQTLKVCISCSLYNVIHHAGPLNPPHVPAPCPHLSPKPTVSSSATLKVSFHHAGPLNPPHVPAPCPQVLP